jgi:hypothetical protein
MEVPSVRERQPIALLQLFHQLRQLSENAGFRFIPKLGLDETGKCLSGGTDSTLRQLRDRPLGCRKVSTTLLYSFEVTGRMPSQCKSERPVGGAAAEILANLVVRFNGFAYAVWRTVFVTAIRRTD